MGVVRQKLTATQLLYRTTDMNGDPDSTVTTVLVPTERDTVRPCPIVSYQCAIDAVAGRCFPSYALRRGAKAVGALAQFEFLLVSAALAGGLGRCRYPTTRGPKASGARRANRATTSSTACGPR